MVFAYALLGVPGLGDDSRRAIEQTEEIDVPDLFRAELVNTVWQWARIGRVPMQTARAVLSGTERLLTRVVPSDQLWQDALELAIARQHSPYDTLFVALAIQTGTRLVTYDRRLRELFPAHAISVPEYLRENSQGRGNFRPFQSY